MDPNHLKDAIKRVKANAVVRFLPVKCYQRKLFTIIGRNLELEGRRQVLFIRHCGCGPGE